jgi:predicted RND superfamily exporter protein
LTSLVISLGFLVVVFSEFSTLREFGLLSAATMVICLATDLILLPALLIRARV